MTKPTTQKKVKPVRLPNYTEIADKVFDGVQRGYVGPAQLRNVLVTAFQRGVRAAQRKHKRASP